MNLPTGVSAGLQHCSKRVQLWLLRVLAKLWSVAQVSDAQAFGNNIRIAWILTSRYAFLFFFPLLLLKVLGNSGWPRYLSSCYSWLHILFAWLFLWRVFTKVSTTFLILFLFIKQRHQRHGLFFQCERSPTEAWLWHHWSFLGCLYQA